MSDNANEQRAAFDKARETTEATKQPDPCAGYSEEPKHVEADPLPPLTKE